MEKHSALKHLHLNSIFIRLQSSDPKWVMRVSQAAAMEECYLQPVLALFITAYVPFVGC